jgi:hypothetical protein
VVALHHLLNEAEAIVPDLSHSGIWDTRDRDQHVLKEAAKVITEVVFNA